MVPQSGELTLEMKRVFPAAPAVVFAAFSDPDKLARWWGPEGFTVPSLEFDPHVGAGYRIEMQPPQDDPFYLVGSSEKSIPRSASPLRSCMRIQMPTTSKRWLSCRFGISASRRRSSTPRGPSRRPHAARF